MVRAKRKVEESEGAGQKGEERERERARETTELGDRVKLA